MEDTPVHSSTRLETKKICVRVFKMDSLQHNLFKHIAVTFKQAYTSYTQTIMVYGYFLEMMSSKIHKTHFIDHMKVIVGWTLHLSQNVFTDKL